VVALSALPVGRAEYPELVGNRFQNDFDIHFETSLEDETVKEVEGKRFQEKQDPRRIY